MSVVVQHSHTSAQLAKCQSIKYGTSRLCCWKGAFRLFMYFILGMIEPLELMFSVQVGRERWAAAQWSCASTFLTGCSDKPLKRSLKENMGENQKNPHFCYLSLTSFLYRSFFWARFYNQINLCNFLQLSIMVMQNTNIKVRPPPL